MRRELRGTRPSMHIMSTRCQSSSFASLSQMNKMLGSLASGSGGQTVFAVSVLLPQLAQRIRTGRTSLGRPFLGLQRRRIEELRLSPNQRPRNPSSFNSFWTFGRSPGPRCVPNIPARANAASRLVPSSRSLHAGGEVGSQHLSLSPRSYSCLQPMKACRPALTSWKRKQRCSSGGF